MSVRHFNPAVYDRYWTLGCNSRLHADYVPDMTLMVDKNLPRPAEGAAIATHLRHWMDGYKDGDVYSYQLGGRLKFHPDTSTARIDYSVTSAYMAMVFAYHMGYRTFTFVGLDLGQVDGKDRMDSPGSGVGDGRKRFFATCYNHLCILITKMGKYRRCRFYSLSPHSQLLQNGYVKQAEVPSGIVMR